MKALPTLEHHSPLFNYHLVVLNPSFILGVQELTFETMHKQPGMPFISRREFIKTASSSAVLGAVLSTGGRALYANPLGLPLGWQTWPLRALIAKDCRRTLKELAAP